MHPSFTFVLFVLLVAGVGALRVRIVRKTARERVAQALASQRARFGPMSPAKFVKLTVAAAQNAATETLTGLVMPNVVRAEVCASDYDSWGPLAGQQERDIAAALIQRVTTSDDLVLLGAPQVTVVRSTAGRPHSPRYQFSLRRSTQPVGQVAHDAESGPRGANRGRPTQWSPAQEALPDNVVVVSQRPTGRLVAVQVAITGTPVFESELGEGTRTFGRGERCAVHIDNDTVSEYHFEMRVSRDGVTVRDLRSTNKTHIRGVGLANEPTAVFDRDVVVLSSEVNVVILRGAGVRERAA